MNILTPAHKDKVLYRLSQIQHQIIGWGENISEKILFPDNERLQGLGLGWSHYVSEILMGTGFTVYSAINADADYSFTVALGDKYCDMTPYFEVNKPIAELYSFKGKDKPLRKLRANIDLRLGQIGIGKPIDCSEMIDSGVINCPFNFLWTEVMFKQIFSNGITALSGIDCTGHAVLVYLQADEKIELDPSLVRNAGLRKSHL